MSDFPPRIAVVGCGYWGMNHIRTLAGLGALAAVVDHHKERAAQIAAEHNTVALDLVSALADETIDGVVCALPADQHPIVAKQALEAGKHVLVEKPMALTTALAQEIVDLADMRKCVLMTGHILRYHAAFERVMGLLKRDAIGDVCHIQSHRLAFGKFHERFDALWDLGPHDLSLVLAVTGRAPDRVRGELVSFAADQCDGAHVHMGFGNNVTAHIYVSRHSPYRERRFVITGTDGMIVWDDLEDWPRKVALYEHRVWHEGPSRHFSLSDPAYQAIEPNMALTDELVHFIDCIRSGTMPLTPGRQAVDVISILEKAGQ